MKMGEQLESFAKWYLEQPRRPRPPCEKSVHFVEGLVATVIYRMAPFQVELVTCSPNLELPEHSHPNVDSFELYLSGALMFSLDGKQIVPDEEAAKIGWDGVHHLIGSSLRVPAGAPHGLRVGPNGGTFLSIQQWLNNKPLSTVGDDWDGDAMGPIHAARIAVPEGIGSVGAPPT